MTFVTILETSQNRNGVFDVWLLHNDGLKSTFQSRVFFDVFTIFIQRCSTHAVQLAASQSRLQQIGSIHRAFGIARADDCMEFIDEHDDLTIGALHFFQHGLQSIFELTAILSTGHQSAHVECEDAFVLEVLRNVAQHDTVSEAFHDRGLSDTWFTNQHRVILATT